MTKTTITRRGFLKLAGAAAASTAVLTGCGPASRYVVREPYANMPEYTYNGESTYYATTCQECPAGCGIVVRTIQGRAIKVEGNPLHPVNAGKTCARGQASIQGLYNPDRVHFPIQQNRSTGLAESSKVGWDEAVTTVSKALRNNSPGQIAFMMGMTHDHLADLVTEIFAVSGSSRLVRISAGQFLGEENSIEFPAVNYDVQNADLILSFGAHFLESWGSPVSYTRQYAAFRKGKRGRRGYLVHFEPRMSQTAAVADEWIPIIPGTEAFAALALGRIISEAQGQLPEKYAQIDPATYAEMAGVEVDTLTQIAWKFVEADAPLAIPSGLAPGQMKGDAKSAAVISLNELSVSFGKPAMLSAAPSPIFGENAPSSIEDIQNLIDGLNKGEIKTIFIHGTNPVFDIPAAFGFKEALAKAETIISFSSFPDETALSSDYILPDHTTLESWGYQRVQTAVSGPTISGLQPAVVPYFDTRSTVDILLAAVQLIGGDLAAGLPYEDEVAYLEGKLSSALLGKENALIRAGEAKTFMSQFQQFGGWWNESSPTAAEISSTNSAELQNPNSLGNDEFYLHVFMHPILGEKGANKPWLQETPDPNTTVMWNTWIEINPETAKELGVHDDDIVQLQTPHGQISASVYLYPAIRPDTIAIPFGQGHTAYGRYAQDRGVNPFDLLGAQADASGKLSFNPARVKIIKTGEHKQLARLESRIGVYGFDDH